MRQYPPIPRVDDAPEELFERGHLWIQEWIDGAHLRFRLRESGALEFGDRRRTFDSGEVPLAYRHAVRHVRESLDREALRAALPDVESVAFFGVATHERAIRYDWDRTPSFLGFDVWSGADGRFRPPDATEKIYERLGLAPVNAFQKEVRAADFDPGSYEIPDSAWYDGPAAGVVVRAKTGERAKLLDPRFEDAEDASPADAPASELAARYATDALFERLASRLERRGRPVTFDAMYDRALEAVARERHASLFHEGADVDLSAFRSEVAERLQEFL